MDPSTSLAMHPCQLIIVSAAMAAQGRYRPIAAIGNSPQPSQKEIAQLPARGK
jgi:hypothetical protein